jgi:ABC-type thiamine transport system ATPase subunit
LARVFVKTQAKIIILDEALGQMDAYKKRGMVVPALTRFVKKWNMTLIIISHDMVSIEGASAQPPPFLSVFCYLFFLYFYLFLFFVFCPF